MHKQDNTTTDKGLEAIMESMYNEKTVPCDKCNGEGCDHCNGTGTHNVEEDEDTGRIPHDVDSFKGPDDQDNTSYQVAAELDAAAGGDFIAHLNTIEWTDEGAAALVEWINRYNLGAS